MMPSEPGVEYAPLFYKPLEIEKDVALNGACGNCDSEMSLSTEGIDCVKWWISMLGLQISLLSENLQTL